MNFFCLLYGHTWVHEAQDAKVRWNSNKDQNELQPTAEGEPKFFRKCVRCGQREPWPEKSA